MNSLLLSAFTSLILLSSVQPSQFEPEQTYDVLYNDGIDAYMQERWFECMTLMQKSLQDFHFFQDNLANCRLRCQNIPKSEADPRKHLELTFFESSLIRSNCLRRCKLRNLPGRPETVVTEAVQSAFESLLPYDYLQICAYKAEKYKEAVSAAYTFLLSNPDHETMQNNVAFYHTMEQVQPEYFHDLEGQKHQYLYQKAVEEYAEDDHAQAAKTMEEAIHAYYLAFYRCSVLCEGEYDHESLPEFYNALADHWIQVLKCKSTCPEKIAAKGTERKDSYLPEHYNYLQFSYYKVGQLSKAAACAATYLVVNPRDQAMTGNVEFYKTQDGVTETDFTPREEAKKYVEELAMFHQMREFVRTEYKYSQADEDVNGDGVEDEQNEEEIEETNPIPLEASLFGPRDEKYLENLMAFNEERGVHLVAENRGLEGNHRVAVDGMLSQEECGQLLELADIGARTGDGYSVRSDATSPHTDYERFAGMTVNTAAEMASSGRVSKSQAELYLRASELGRSWLEKYYNLNTHLYFAFTHLVCRTALDKDQAERKDLSHPVHADNCFIQADGSCLKRAPAYTMRDLTGLIYLNDDFEGGNFFFAHRNQSVQKTVQPKCGRMVGFESSDYHGVKALTKGRRCAVAMWYTLDPEHQETAHVEAHTMLSALGIQDKPPSNPSLQSYLQEKDYKLAMTEEALKGPERFAVDGMLSEDMCQSLIQLANEGAVEGDGYHAGKNSPFTEMEKFVGLTVDRSAQLAAQDKVDVKAVNQYLASSEAGREMVQKYFNLEGELYFSYTHLVCRTALHEKELDRTDLSHPVHSDNCIIQPDNSCKKERPAYIERDYSAILYLNDDFLGGEFFFAHQNLSMQSSLRPKCGRLVGFNSGNYHGVKAVLKGQRCAVALWFTMDHKFKEASHGIARNILKQHEGKPRGPPHVEL